jgi:very-short-patch-repair endonuclease
VIVKTYSHLEDKFLTIWNKLAPDLILESQYKDKRIRGVKRPYVFDFHVVGTNILIEINGGTGGWKMSAHRTAQGMKRDYKKLNKAHMNGYSVFCFSSTMIDEQEIKEVVKYAYYIYNNNKTAHKQPPIC